MLAFNANLEAELLALQEELRGFSYRPGPYRQFRIRDPKPRLISAAPYRDRVVHHAHCVAIVPPLERRFHQGSHANRLGYGSHRALRRCTAPVAGWRRSWPPCACGSIRCIPSSVGCRLTISCVNRGL